MARLHATCVLRQCSAAGTSSNAVTSPREPPNQRSIHCLLPAASFCSALQAGTPNQLTIQQPGMQVQVTQPWIGRQAPWLDVAVQLTRPPAAPSGVLGATFPRLASLARSSG